MTLAKLKLAAGLVAACGALTAGGVWAGGQKPGAEGPGGRTYSFPQPPAAAQPPKPERRTVDPKAPNPGKPEDPKRTADATARRADLNKLKQLALAMHNYHDTHGQLPRDVVGKDGKPLLSWRVLFLPYLEQEWLYKQFKQDEPWDSPTNAKLAVAMPDVYRLAFQPKGATATYFQAFAGPGTVFDPTRRKMTFLDITDGMSRTLMLAPVGPPVPWTKPADVAYGPAKPFPKIVWPYANTLPAANTDGSCFHLRPDLLEWQLRQYIEAADDQPWQGDEFEKLRQSFPANTAAEKAEVRKLLAESADTLAATAAVFREYLRLADAGTVPLPDFDKAAETNEGLKQFLERTRAELAGRTKPAAPPAK